MEMNEILRTSILPKEKKWKLVWHDEFDGDTLDETKWSYRRHLWHRESPTFTDEGVTLKDSCMYISLIEKDGNYYSAHLQTGENYLDRPNPGKDWVIAPFSKPKFMHKYGYYECRCKLQQSKGWWSAFWLQSPIIGCCPDPAKAGIEIDIMESFADYGKIDRNTISCNAHWSGYNYDSNDYRTFGLHAHTLKPTDDDFHVYGVDWARDGYRFYVDGEQTAYMEGPVSDTEQFILISTECNGYRNNPPKPCKELLETRLPDAFVVDYVRVYDEVNE